MQLAQRNGNSLSTSSPRISQRSIISLCFLATLANALITSQRRLTSVVAAQEENAPKQYVPARTAPPLPAPQGKIVTANEAGQIREALENAAEGTTILIADGDYRVNRPIYMKARKKIIVRSASGDPGKVTLRGQGWESGSNQDDILRIGDCEDITVADLTFADCRSYGVKVEAEHNPRQITIYNCHFRDIGTRAIKGSGGRGSAVGGSIRFCHFENTKIPPNNWLYEGNYISAIDMMALDGWVISDNVFRNIKGRTGGGRAAIFVWVLSKNVTVERNLIVDCDRGIAFGNPSPSSSGVGTEEYHMRNGTCRNNFIVPGPDAGIELWWVDGIQVYHNTIWRPAGTGRGIRFGARAKGVHIAHNLVRGAIMHEKDGSSSDARIENNLTGPLDGYFVDPRTGDLHLTAQAFEAVDKVIALPGMADDFDGSPRTGLLDLGADEFAARR